VFFSVQDLLFRVLSVSLLHLCRLSAVRCDRPRPVFESRVIVMLLSVIEGSNKGIEELVNLVFGSWKVFLKNFKFFLF
jgi:hypothetical protein